MRSQGQYWCPRCFCKRDFVLALGASDTEDLPDLECAMCEYTYTMVTTETGSGPPSRYHPITKAMRQAAQLELRAQFMRQLDTNGHERELVTQGRLRRTRGG